MLSGKQLAIIEQNCWFSLCTIFFFLLFWLSLNGKVWQQVKKKNTSYVEERNMETEREKQKGMKKEKEAAFHSHMALILVLSDVV